MKRIVQILIVGLSVAAAGLLQAQTKFDEQRMERDIEVAENVLSTLIRQQFTKRNFFPFEVEGTYSAGYGVTFRIPMEFPGTMIFGMAGEPKIYGLGQGHAYAFSYSSDSNNEEEVGDHDEEKECDDCAKAKEREKEKYNKDKDREKNKNKNTGWNVNKGRVRVGNSDSLKDVFNTRVIAAAKDFIADYGDLIGQLTPDERIKITNRHEGQRFWYSGDNSARRKFISLECMRGDITQFKQGKITREVLMNKITVVDSESTEEISPDLELLSTMFDRLYRADLSKTYYNQENVYYERLKNYGVVYYMQVYSSNEVDLKKYDMPTLNLERIDKETRDKKVVELYPLFEKDVKANMLDYGRTLKSLKNDEVLVMNVRMTQCKGCGIPSSLELSVKDAVLKDYDSGKLTKEAASGMITVKKGPNQ